MSLQGQTGLWGGVGGGIISKSPSPPWPDYTWSTTTFTPSGAYGNLGPTQTQFNSQQSGKPFMTDYQVCVNGIQYVRLPTFGSYNFKLWGAYGGPGDPWQATTPSSRGGIPRYLDIDVTIPTSSSGWIGIIVGQKGGYSQGNPNSGGGGGGASYIFTVNSNSANNTTFPSSIESSALTPLAVASGGNGANWISWTVDSVNGRAPTTSTTDWIPTYAATITSPGYQNFGRGGMGASFDYTPYYWVAPGTTYWSGYSSDLKEVSAAPIKTSTGFIHPKSGAGGICFNGSPMTDYSNSAVTSQCGAGGNGGFGGGAGAQFEGGGGGGYWGGATNKTNDYATAYDFGGQSYVAPGSTTNQSDLASNSPAGVAPDGARSARITYPWPDSRLDGKIIIAKN